MKVVWAIGILFFCFSYVYSGNVQLNQNVFLPTPKSQFGIAVGLSNSTLVVGATDIAAYVFLFDPVQLVWGLQGTLSVDTGSSISGYNYATKVAIFGDHVMVGAPNWSEDTNNQQAGTVFAFMRTGTTWQRISQIDALDPSPSALFGSSVSLSGTTVLIGAMRKDSTGAAYFAQYTEQDGWTVTSKVVPADGAAYDLFGSSVSLDGNVAVVGAPYHRPAGAVYVFQQNMTMVTVTLQSPDVTATYFGYAVAVSGSTLVVGAYGYNNYGGIAYVYVRQGNTWVFQAPLLASDAAPGAFFGVSVDVYGGSGIIVGSAIQENLKNGNAYVYAWENDQWNEQEKLSVNGSLGDRFGWSVSLDGYVAAVGAPDINAAYVYTVLCPPGTYGSNCSYNCSCPATGVCSSGISGDGTCKSCIGNFFGKYCSQPCTCQNGTCDNNPITGNGKCSSCSSSTFGPNCNRPCNCTNGLCDNNPTNGTGKCLSCFPPHYGPTCSSQCTCSNGICDTSTSGKGECLSCNSGYYGPTCGLKCHENCLTCYDGVSGNGTCLTCTPGFAGPNCAIPCPHGCTTCLDGVNGDGTCITCPVGTWGPTCALCTCVQGRGTCDLSTGECNTCIRGYWGSDCNELCLCRTNPSIFCFDGPMGNGTCIVPIPPVPPLPPSSPVEVQPAPEEDLAPYLVEAPEPQSSGSLPLLGVWAMVVVILLLVL